jgi:hypothetical protein
MLQQSSRSVRKNLSMVGLSVGLFGIAGCTVIPSRAQTPKTCADMYCAPRSYTTASSRQAGRSPIFHCISACGSSCLTNTFRGIPWNGAMAAVAMSVGETHWYRTFATSADFVEIGVNRSPRMQRLYKSIATVNSTGTQRSVTGSIANTSSGVVSNTTYSPGRVARSRPYGPDGRFATDRRALPLPNAYLPLASSSNRRYAVAYEEIGTASEPCSVSTRSAVAAMIAPLVGVDRLVY